MAQVYVKYNPYRLETTLMVNGRPIANDSILHKLTKGKRLQEWIGRFPRMLREELNTVDFSLEFCGMDLDWDDFEDAFKQAQEAGIVRVSGMKYTAGKSDEDITAKIVRVFRHLQVGPIDDFRDPRLLRTFEAINDAVFPIHVIATMSSGKSTLINALLGRNLMPSKNLSCTAAITEILDIDDPNFSAVAYDCDNVQLRNVPKLTLDAMKELNDDEKVARISAEGDIPFLDSKSTALMLVDTPGPNSAQNQAHMNTTYRAIKNDSNNLILYVLNATNLASNDDASLLRYVAEQIKKGGKQVRDRFLFVINKMDEIDPDTETVESAIRSAKNYLATFGIEDPQIFPCSAFTALNARTYFSDIDIDSLTRAQIRMLPHAARKTVEMIEDFVLYESMHLEKYTTLSPSAQQELNYRLSQAEANNDKLEQALIHSGIYSIEAAITAYVKKYAKTKKVKDLVESFQEVLESNGVLANARDRVMTDADAARACAERRAAIEKKIADGREAQAFQQRIDALDPLPRIEAAAEQLAQNAAAEASTIFRPYGDTITNRNEAKQLVAQFTTFSSRAMGKLTSELESIINREIVDTGKRLLEEYQEKVVKFDDASSDEQLDFHTVDLIKGALKTMRDTAESWTTDEFAAETVDNFGDTTYETKTYYEKVGQEEEEKIVGSHQEKIGTKRVKVGTERKEVGRKSVAKWYNPFSWFKTEPIYKDFPKYEDQDVYKTVYDYQKVWRDIFEERTETIEKFHVSTAAIQTALISKIRQNLDLGTKNAVDFAAEQVTQMKDQFSQLFSALDQLICAKYEELEACASDQARKNDNLRANQKLLNWIEENLKEIDAILDL